MIAKYSPFTLFPVKQVVELLLSLAKRSEKRKKEKGKDVKGGGNHMCSSQVVCSSYTLILSMTMEQGFSLG